MATLENHGWRPDKATAGNDERVFSFGEYRLIPQRQLLLRGAHPVRIGSRALDLLYLLVERQGQLVSKEQLIGHAWPDTFVHESNLKVNIAALRRALPQGRSEFPFIATVPGRGYRFVSPVRVEVETTPPPAPTSAAPMGDNLPPQHILVGRDADIAELSAKLIATGFVTIAGPAGVGKTTAAIAVARQVAERYEDGVCFVDFSTIGDSRLVLPAIVSALGAGGNLTDMLFGIVEALRDQRRLLLFDNCEHVLSATTMVADHLRVALPDIGLLATSREPLRSQFETVHLLPPLTWPEEGHAMDCDEAMRFSAIELFVARAKEATGYDLQTADIPAVIAICRRLDGIALAIELAAPRLASHEPATLLHRLQQSFEWLNYGPRDAPARHQALLATLDWSYRLLSDREAKALRLLSVFAGRFTLEDVVGLAAKLDLPADEITRSLGNLASKSLLSSSIRDGQLQYRLLDATRGYAAERLCQEGEAPGARAGHANFMLGLFEQAEDEWRWRSAQEWTASYAPRLNDLRKAIDWALGERVALPVALRLTAAAIPLLDQLSLVGESRQRVQRALVRAGEEEGCEAALRMKLTMAYAWGLTFSKSLGPETETAWRDSLVVARQTGNIDYQLRALWGLAALLSFTGRHREALRTLEAFPDLTQQERDSSATPDGERLQAMIAFYCGDIRPAHEQLTRLARDHGTVGSLTRAARFQLDRYVAIRISLAAVAWVRGDLATAERAAANAVAGALQLGHAVSHANALAFAALPLALWTGAWDTVETHVAALTDNLNRQDIGIWGPVSRFFSGAALNARHDIRGIETMRAALDEIVASRFLVRAPFYATVLAEASLDRDQLAIARSSLATALAQAEEQEERWCLPEIYRLQGLLAWRDGDPARGEHALLQAISVARDMGADTFELKAAMSLAERWVRHGRPSEALELLQSACDRFGPCARGDDLMKARTLLEQWRTIQAA